MDQSFSRARRVLLAATLLAALGGIRSAAQQPEQPTFRSGVQVVEVDVRVFGPDGRFVGDLTRDDFEILEQGQPQQIVALYQVDETGIVQVAPAATRTPGTAATVSRTPSARQAWIFAFDLNHLTPGGGFDRARMAVEEYIETRFKDGDLGGILAGSRMINNRLSSVRAELLAAVREVKPLSDARSRFIELTREWPRLQDETEALQIAREDREALRRAVIRACSDDATACQTADMQVRAKAQRFRGEIHRASLETLKALNALASGLARIPGPKTIVFLSDGFVVQDIETTFRGIVGQTARAGARVYAIDVRGLNRVGNSGLLDQAQANDPAGGPARIDSGEDGPNSLAVDTGGLMIRNENNLGRALERIASDANRYYVVAYQPSDANFDGKFRPIEVNVRREGVRVRARRGYLALEPSRMLVPVPAAPTGRIEDGPPMAAPSAGLAGDAQLPGVSATPVDREDRASAEAAPSARGASAVATLIDRAGAATPVRLGPKTIDARAREGWARYAKGDVEGAREALVESATGDAPPWVFYALGLTEFALLEFGRAAEAWTRVQQQVPDFRDVYFDLADAHIQMRAYSDAVAVLREAAGRWPEDPEVFNAIGVVQARRDALDEAVESFRRAVALAPSDPLGHFNLARALELRYTRNLRYFPATGRWVGRDSDRTEAITEYQRYLELGGPQEASARESLSRLEWKH